MVLSPSLLPLAPRREQPTPLEHSKRGPLLPQTSLTRSQPSAPHSKPWSPFLQPTPTRPQARRSP